MAGRLRLLAVPLLLVLVPCAAIGIIGYQWLRLERAQEADCLSVLAYRAGIAYI